MSITKLQAGLTVVLYLIDTSTLKLARHQIQIITSSSTIQNLFRAGIQPKLSWFEPSHLDNPKRVAMARLLF